MPEVLAPAALFALGVCLWFMCEAIVYMLRAIAAALGNPHIGVISIPIGRWFKAATSGVVTWLVDICAGLLWPVTRWMIGVPFVLKGLFTGVIGALDAHATQISHLYNTAIPEAGRHAQSTATGYVNVQIAGIHTDLRDATAEIEKAADADAATALAKAEGHAGTIKASLTKLVAHDLTVAKRYTDTAVKGLQTQVKALADAIPAPAGAIPVPHDVVLPAPVAVPIPNAPAITISDTTEMATAIAAVGAAVVAITSEFDSCAVTSCDGPNNLQGLLNTILGLAGLAEFAVFLKDAIDNPAGVESEYAATFQGIIQPLVTGGGDVFSALEAVLGL